MPDHLGTINTSTLPCHRQEKVTVKRKQNNHMRWNKYIASLTIQSQIVGDDAIDQGMREPTQKISFPLLFPFQNFMFACFIKYLVLSSGGS